jgi:hypothetical protein
MATDPKKALFAKGRKLRKEIQTYAAQGYVKDRDDWQEEDLAIWRRIDRLYDAQRKAGLLGDPELDALRIELRKEMSAARKQAHESRVMMGEARLRVFDQEQRERREQQAGMTGYLQDLELARIRGKL